MMLFTNNEIIAEAADRCGVDQVVIDLEMLGKSDRQKNFANTRISAHQLSDVARIRPFIHTAELLVRINPIHEQSPAEIEQVLAGGADIIMLPYFKTLTEIRTFLDLVKGRARTCLLLETKEAEALIDEIIALGGFDSIQIGINDLAISKGLSFLFESLLQPEFEPLCDKIRNAGIPFGFGGITRLEEGKVPSRFVIPEHYRLGSCQIILGRSFLSAEEVAADPIQARDTLIQAVADVRSFEAGLADRPASFFTENSRQLKAMIADVVEEIKARG
jgi:2-keto-3-deoxy-L-rhamnonate aldolase RhmA